MRTFHTTILIIIAVLALMLVANAGDSNPPLLWDTAML